MKTPTANPDALVLPRDPEGTFAVSKQVGNGTSFGNTVYLDRFRGEVSRIDSEEKAALGDRILNSFYPLPIGSFWGLPSRVFYVFVGLAPAALPITGLVMARYRRRGLDRPTASSPLP